MSDDVARTLNELLAHVEALEAWRAHQSDLLDDLINGDDLRSDPDPGQDVEPEVLNDRELIDWVHRSVAGVIARRWSARMWASSCAKIAVA